VASGVVTEGARTREQKAAELAAELIVFADGAEEAGLITYAQRARAVAREAIWLADALENAERSLGTMTEERDKWRDERWREQWGMAWPK
jgi:hypothetical protein